MTILPAESHSRLDTIWTNPSHGSGPKIPVSIGNIGHIKNLTQDNFSEVCRVITKATLTPTYPSGWSRSNHDGTHSARQARMLQVVLKHFEQDPVRTVNTLTEEERMLLQLGAYLLRSGRIDESSHIDANPDDYNTRSAMIFEAYAKQLDVSKEAIDWIKNIIFYSCKPYADTTIHNSAKQSLAWKAFSVVHELDLIRCFSKKDIDGRVANLVKQNLLPYLSLSTNEVTKKLFTFSKELCAATGCARTYDGDAGNYSLFYACSRDGDLCWKRVSAVKYNEVGEYMCITPSSCMDRSLVKEQLHNLRIDQPIGWQEQSVKLIRKTWVDSPDQELQRLREWGVLDKTREQLLANMTNSQYCTSSCSSKKQSAKAMVGRALELQSLYTGTHNVFLHAQSSKWILISDLIKECMKAAYPEKNLHQFKCLRIPSEKWVSADISQYKNKSTHDHDLKTREDLISADGYFYNTAAGESAFYFMWHNSNIMNSSHSIALSIIQIFFPRLTDVEQKEFAQRIIKVSSDASAELGNLFIFCLPKEQSEKIQYRAHPFGRVCACYKEDKLILDVLQKGHKVTCGALIPQFRIFTPALRREDGVKSYLISPNRSQRQLLKQKIREIVCEMKLNGLRIRGSSSKMCLGWQKPKLD